MAGFSFQRPKLRLSKFTFAKQRQALLTFLRERFGVAAKFSRRRPIISLLVALALLLGLILAGNLFVPKVAEVPNGPQTKQVRTYTIGSVPKVAVQAQIQNSGVITITALSGGVVQKVNVVEGQQVKKNANLITLASNYDGSSAPAIQQGIAFQQLKQINDTLPAQIEIIQKQRDVANSTEQNATALRDISARSVVDLQAIADLNQNMLDTVKTDIADLEELPTDPDTQADILRLKGLQNQLQTAQNQTHQQLLNTQFQVDPVSPPSKLVNLQKDITLKTLDIQEKGLQIQKEIAQLQVALAGVSAALLHPTAPFGATVEKVLVREGQAIPPGTPLLLLVSDKQDLTAVAKVPASMAKQISQIEDSVLHLGQTTVAAKPVFISDVATDGLLYSVIYTIEGYTTNLTDSDYIGIDIPVGLPSTSSAIPFVPLDSIFQTQEKSYLYLNNNGTVESRTVKTGEVLGSFVQIEDGLKNGDQVILNRNVVEGDKVNPQ